MNTEYVAVDIALIPEQKIIEEAMRVSRKYCAYEELPLNSTHTFPHISLMMLIVKATELASLSKEIVQSKSVARAKALKLEISSSTHKKSAGGDLLSSWDIALDDRLLSLHKALAPIYNSFHHSEIDDSNIMNSPDLGKHGMEYIRQFRNEHSGKHYEPHITIGYGNEIDCPKGGFNVNRLGVYQLAKHCSCFRAFWETNI